MTTHDEIVATAAITEEAESGPGFKQVNLKVSAAHNTAIATTIARMRADVGDLAETLAELDGKKVTLLITGENMMGARIVIARPGTLFNGGTALLPKGKRTNGVRINVDSTLAVVVGYDTAAAAELYEAYDVGDVAELTADTLLALPSYSDGEDDICTLAVLTTTSICDTKADGCVWLIHSYDPETDICDGMLTVPNGAELESEYGSIYGANLIGSAAVLTGAKPVPFAAAIHFESTDQALAAIGR